MDLRHCSWCNFYRLPDSFRYWAHSAVGRRWRWTSLAAAHAVVGRIYQEAVVRSSWRDAEDAAMASSTYYRPEDWDCLVRSRVTLVVYETGYFYRRSVVGSSQRGDLDIRIEISSAWMMDRIGSMFPDDWHTAPSVSADPKRRLISRPGGTDLILGPRRGTIRVVDGEKSLEWSPGCMRKFRWEVDLSVSVSDLFPAIVAAAMFCSGDDGMRAVMKRVAGIYRVPASAKRSGVFRLVSPPMAVELAAHVGAVPGIDGLDRMTRAVWDWFCLKSVQGGW